MSSRANKTLRAEVWLGMTAMCVHCGRLIVVVDAYEDYPELHSSVLEWQHATGFYACYYPGHSEPMAEPALDFESAWQGHPTARVPGTQYPIDDEAREAQAAYDDAWMGRQA